MESTHAPDHPRAGQLATEASPAALEPALMYCPICDFHLVDRGCKLSCPRCHYYMSCADYY